jgi:hypothetical protein
MKKMISAVAGLLITAVSASAGAQTLGNYYLNAFTLGADGSQGGYEFGFGWTDPALLRIDQNGNSITFYPNTSLCRDDANWCDATNELGGNWYVEASAFAETVVNAGDAAQDFEFKGCFTGGTLTSNHTLVAFMQVLNPDAGFAVYDGTYQADSTGCWNFTHSETGANNAVVQYGLKMVGQNVDPAFADQMGYYGATLNAEPAPPLPADAARIPTLPVGALLVLLGLVGWIGGRRLRA